MRVCNTLLVLGVCFFNTFFNTLATAQEVYQAKDSEGNVVYTDQPPTDGGGMKLKLPPVNVFEAQPVIDLDLSSKSMDREFKYHRLEVTAPKNNETVYINTTNLPIEVRLIPAANQEKGHRLQILMGDKVIVENQQSYLLSEADRGSHVIKARVIDQDKNVLIESAPVTVHIKKPTVNQP